MTQEEFDQYEKNKSVLRKQRSADLVYKRPQPRPKHTPGQMNKTESRYADHLERKKMAGEIVDYKFELIKLRLADKTFYTSDFVVIGKECFEFHEVKGFWEDDARVKIKVAAAQNPWFKFVGVTEKKGQWQFEEF